MNDVTVGNKIRIQQLNDVTAGYKICTRQFTSYQLFRFLLHSARSFIQTGRYKGVIAGENKVLTFSTFNVNTFQWLFQKKSFLLHKSVISYCRPIFLTVLKYSNIGRLLKTILENSCMPHRRLSFGPET